MQMKAALQAQLKEMHLQASWFRDFLLKIASDIPRNEATAARVSPRTSLNNGSGHAVSSVDGGTGNPFDTVEDDAQDLASFSSVGSSQERLNAALAKLSDGELRALIVRSRIRWKEVCDEVQRSA